MITSCVETFVLKMRKPAIVVHLVSKRSFIQTKQPQKFVVLQKEAVPKTLMVMVIAKVVQFKKEELCVMVFVLWLKDGRYLFLVEKSNNLVKLNVPKK